VQMHNGPSSANAWVFPEFSISLPPGFALAAEGGTDSRVRLWSNGVDSISADWGSIGLVASPPIDRPGEAKDWAFTETVLGEAPVQLATYELPHGRYMLEALWPDLGTKDFGLIRFKAVLWISAASHSASGRDAMRESLGTIIFK
jgi:hypothetical protein